MLDYEWSVGTFLSQLFPDNEWRINGCSSRNLKPVVWLFDSDFFIYFLETTGEQPIGNDGNDSN